MKTIVYYDDQNQVMAVESSPNMPEISQEWLSRGYSYIEYKLPERITRNHKLVIKNGEVMEIVTSENPLQPQPSASDLKQKALNALLEKMLQDEMKKPASIPEVMDYKNAR